MTEKSFKVIREVYQVYKDETLYEVSDGTHTFHVFNNAHELEDLLNEQNQQIKELENKITKIEEIIDNRLDNKVIPKWENNNELFIEEKVGYRYALRQLKKKLIREKICFNDINIEDME